jgi:hypothetical protein
MEEMNYILKQAKRFHYTNWDDSELKKCIDMLMDLSRQELVTLYTSRWLSHNKTLKEEVFKLLFSDRIGKLNDKIREMNTDKLIEELLDKKGGMVSLARQELRHRYIENNIEEDRTKIAIAFAQSSLRDNNWLESQMRKELYGVG